MAASLSHLTRGPGGHGPGPAESGCLGPMG